MIRSLVILFLILLSSSSYAQNDLLKQLQKNDTVSLNKPIIYTFKSTRLINSQTVETVAKGFVDIRVTHRFGAIGTSANGTSSYHNLWGFDVSSDIRIAAEFGVTKNLTLGFGRSKYKENLEGLGKYKLLTQSRNNKIPVSITLFSNATFSTKEDPRLTYDEPSKAQETKRRFSFFSQALIARKFSSYISLQLNGGIVHHNFVEFDDVNTVPFVGFGGRIKVSKTMSLVGDYTFNIEKSRYPGNSNHRYNVLGAGFEFDTGGHVFSLIFTNALAVVETEYIAYTQDTWTNGGFRFSFNISRNFDISKKN
jgi:hypothetical protein